MADHEDRLARMALSCVVEAGDLRLRDRLRVQTPQEIWCAVSTSTVDDAWTRRAQLLDLPALADRAGRHGVRFIIPSDPDWPVGLADLDHSEPVQKWGGMPMGLWVRGRGSLAELAADAVAIVGCRASTAYGDRVASELGGGLAATGTTVVSGAAYGIDAAAHRGALAEDGPTIAVMAGGLDGVYPKGNTQLVDEVAQHGLVVSEAPPGATPSRRRFLTRNRLIAGLSAGVIVVEATMRSGARNTVSWASSLMRHVMAVPGPVGSSTSYLPHRLIRENEAVLVTGVDDVRELVSPMGIDLVDRETQPRLLDDLDEQQAAVYEALPSRGSRATDEIALEAGVHIRVALVALEELRARGLAASASDGGWRLGVVQDRPVSAQQQGRGRDG